MSATAPYCTGLGIRLEESSPERVRLRVPYQDGNSNPGKALHGGVAASAIRIAGHLAAAAALDPAAASAVTAAGEPAATGLDARSLDLTVDYLAAAIGEDVVADARVLRKGKELVYSEVRVATDAGKAIAAGLVTVRFAPRATPDRVVCARLADADRAAFCARDPQSEVPAAARLFASVPFIARLGMAVDGFGTGRAAMRLPHAEGVTDADGATHEGALLALLDSAGALASWSVVGLNLRWKASTVGLHASFHREARGEDVLALAEVEARSDEILSSRVRLFGARSGEGVASGAVTYRIVVPLKRD